MRTATAELVRICAQRVLANRDAGRSIDPLTVEWAETILRQNPEPRARVSPQNGGQR